MSSPPSYLGTLKYRQRLEFICAKRGVPWEDCRDIAQEALIAAVDHISHGRFRGESSLETWLIRILPNKIADFHRTQERQGALIPWSTPSNSTELAPEDQVPAGGSDPYLTMVVEDTLRGIPEEHGIILLLNSLEGYTTREIARIVGRSDGRVGAMLAEAKGPSRNNPSNRSLTVAALERWRPGAAPATRFVSMKSTRTSK
jgi:RNA polymerase sigma factor (sigma-70 family)